MSLGSLVSVIGAGARDLTVVVLDNGLYEVTGGQRTPGGRLDDFTGLARAAGFASARSFAELADWKQQATTVLAQPGPRFISLQVEPAAPGLLRFATPPLPEQLAEFRAALK